MKPKKIECPEIVIRQDIKDYQNIIIEELSNKINEVYHIGFIQGYEKALIENTTD